MKAFFSLKATLTKCPEPQYLGVMELLENVPLAPLTTFKLGGPARWYCPARSAADVTDALAFARQEGLPWFVLGRGSNVLVADAGYQGLVLHLSGLATLDWTAAGGTAFSTDGRRLIRCGAGLAIATLASAAAEQGLAGLEFAGGLPGSVGGAAFMNARAYGSELADCLDSLEVITPTGERASRSKEELRYTYKHSALMESGEIILELRLLLRAATDEADRKRISETTAANRNKRVEMGQFVHPNAGCIFKNDYSLGIPSGRLIDECGLRGYRIGGSAVFERHANFIVNTGSASAAEVRQLIRHVQQVVFEKRGIKLEEEVRYLGFEDA